MDALELDDVTKRFGAVVAVDALTLSVEPGERMSVLGPSGCGKSTTLRLVAGLESVTEGKISVGGRDVTKLEPAARRVGMVFQQPATFPHLSVADNLGFGMRLRRAPRTEIKRRLSDVADLLSIGHLLERLPAQLSGGERQRVEIGRALVRDPALLLLDEPFSSLDAALRAELRAELCALQRRVGTTTVLVTHDQTEALSVGDRVAVMRDGRLAQLGRPVEIYDDPADEFVARFVGTPAMNVARVPVERGVARFGTACLVVPASGVGLREVVVGIRPTDLVLCTQPRADAAVRMDVVAVEDHGADLIARGHTPDGITVTVRLPRTANPRSGDALALAVERHHTFHPITGAALR